MKYYSHHIGDFDRATRHLTRIERSIYRDLMDYYYDTEQALPLDTATLCRKIIARSDEERTAVEQVLNEFFIKTDAGWFNSRCDSELERYRSTNSQKSAAGKASAEKRAAKKQLALDGNSTGVGTGVDLPLNGDPTNHKPVTKNQKKPKPSSSSGDDALKPFDQFWQAYPRKVGKVDAQKAWAKLKPTPELVQTILEAIAAQKEGHDWKREAGEFIPHPTTWLNGGRWLDEVRPYVEPQQRQNRGQWWATKEAMVDFGLTLTPPLKPNPGEHPQNFAKRIQDALERIDRGEAPPPAAAPTPYIPPAPVGGESVLSIEQQQARRQELLALAGSRKNLTEPAKTEETTEP